MTTQGGWTTLKRKRKGTLSDKLLDLATETGKHHILVMARQAKAGQLGEAGVAKAWRLLGSKPARGQQPKSDLAKAAVRRAEAAERITKDLKERLAKLESQRARSDKDDAEMDAGPAEPARRRAPEVVAAEAESHAVALTESAARLRNAGLTEEAEALEKKAAEFQKKAVNMPSLAKRIEMKESFIERARGRVQKGSQAIQDAENKLKDAQGAMKTYQKELAEAQVELDQLRTELSGGQRDPASMSASDGSTRQATAQAIAAEADELRRQLARATEEASTLHRQNADMLGAGRHLESDLAAANAEKNEAERRHAELRVLGSEEFKKRLEKCFQDHHAALASSNWDSASSLAETTHRLTAALREAEEMERNPDF